MHIWPLQEAKAKLSEVVKLCGQEPQIISLRGKEEVIMLSMSDYERMIQSKGDFVTFMRNSPFVGLDIDFTRDKSVGREIDL